MKLLGALVMAAAVVAVAATGWARSTGRQSDGPVTAPTAQPATHAPSAQTPTSADATPAPAATPPTLDLKAPGVGGLNVRYLDPSGEIKHLDVKDFPR